MTIDATSASKSPGRSRLESAAERFQAGDLAAAATICADLLRDAPGNADAENLLGVIACLQGDPARGIPHLERAIASAAFTPQYHANLARARQDTGDYAGARRSFEKAVTLNPADAAIHCELAEVLVKLDQPLEALAHLQHAARLAPHRAAIQNDLGNLLLATGQAHEALAAYERAALIDSRLPEPFLNGALVFNRLGRPEAAEPAARRAVLLAPDSAPAHFQLGQSLRRQRRHAEAVQSYRKTLELNPDDAQVHHYLGFCLYHLGRLEEAHARFQQAVDQVTHAPDSQRFLALIEMAWGDPERAIARTRDAVAAFPDHAELLAYHPYCLNLAPDATPAAILDAHRAYDRAARASQPALPPVEPTRDGKRRLRIGYVSPDFRAHSVSFFIEPILARQDRDHFEVHCYHLHDLADATTERLRALADHWLDCAGMSDEQLAERIRQDGIDLLIDLAGHTRDARPALLATKPAPRQALFLGYPSTMGLAANDFRISDSWVDPAGYEAFNQERLLRLPQSYFCFRPDAAPDVAVPPCECNGYITFGSFNNLAKLNGRVVAAWAELLGRVAGSRLLLKAATLGDANVRQRIADRFRAAGVHADRLVLEGHTASMAEHLARYDEIDIALDTFPYNGATTTCQALWMGVPVVSFAGDTQAGRMGLSILNAAGLPELVGNDPGEYLDIAASLTNDPTRLQSLRRRLRDLLRASPLMDECAYVRAFDALCHQAAVGES